MDQQVERSYQKQGAVFENKKRVLGRAGKSGARYVKNIGLGFKTPTLAKEGNYIDKKCPFTGNVSIRGRILTGVVKSLKMKRTCIVRRDYLHYISKYNRFEKRHRNLAAHISPAFRDVALGDQVTVGQCRPLSKTVRAPLLKETGLLPLIPQQDQGKTKNDPQDGATNVVHENFFPVLEDAISRENSLGGSFGTESTPPAHQG